MFCGLLAAAAIPLMAQRGGGGSAGGGARTGGGVSSGAGSSANAGTVGQAPSSPTFDSQPFGQPGPLSDEFNMPSLPPLPRPTVVEDESCMPWTLQAVRGATVSVLRLDVPSKARGEYDKGCSAYKKGKLAEAEGHMRDAISKYSSYVAAWVMLGQTLAAESQFDKADNACTRAVGIDATYVPPYLCLADLAARKGQWDQLLGFSDSALGLNPVGDAYAYYFQSLAYFQLRKLPEARKSAMQAAEIDQEHRQVELYFLLAQIDEAQGNLTAAMAHLKQFLKFNPDKQEAAVAREYLAKLENVSPKQSIQK